MSASKKPLAVRCSPFMAAFVLISLMAVPISAQSKKKIAVLQFDDRTAATGNMSIGAKVADALLSKLAGGGAFEVVDREDLQRVEAEQNTRLEDRFDPAGGAKIGKLLNVNALIVGKVEAFNANVEVQTKKGFASNKQTSVGTVELKVTARLINVETGSILCAPTANAEQSETLAESSSSNLVRGLSSSSSTNVQSALLKLVDKSVDDVAQSLSTQVVANSGTIPNSSAQGAVSARVIGLQDGQVLANKGTNAGIKVGDKFAVTRQVDTGLKDPDTGKPVVRRKKICVLAISEVEDSISVGKCEGDAPHAGDELTPNR
jgi:curli biogenesis system outer membrane secretion channel CsgG